MTKQQREELRFLKREIDSTKSRLIDFQRKVEELSPSQGEQLGRIIGRLEHWQNKK